MGGDAPTPITHGIGYWTNINGVDYKIIITDCKVDETETGVWEATITYTYSLI